MIAGVFAMVGYLKLTIPVEQLAKVVPDMPVFMVRFIGISELLGAAGVLLPWLTRIRPALTSLAAGALAVVMVLAVGFHISRGEVTAIGAPILLGALAAFVAWGRSRES